MGLASPCGSRCSFRTTDHGFFEVRIMLCSVMGMGMGLLLLTILAIVKRSTYADLLSAGSVAGLGYCTWAIGQFVGKERWANCVKALFA